MWLPHPQHITIAHTVPWWDEMAKNPKKMGKKTSLIIDEDGSIEVASPGASCGIQVVTIGVYATLYLLNIELGKWSNEEGSIVPRVCISPVLWQPIAPDRWCENMLSSELLVVLVGTEICDGSCAGVIVPLRSCYCSRPLNPLASRKDVNWLLEMPAAACRPALSVCLLRCNCKGWQLVQCVLPPGMFPIMGPGFSLCVVSIMYVDWFFFFFFFEEPSLHGFPWGSGMQGQAVVQAQILVLHSAAAFSSDCRWAGVRDDMVSGPCQLCSCEEDVTINYLSVLRLNCLEAWCLTGRWPATDVSWHHTLLLLYYSGLPSVMTTP